ncbi:MAG: efflux RND transporter permease subunit [Niameybacter sp.]
MKITALSIKRPVTTFMLICIVLIFGFVAFFNLSIDLLPSFDLPMLVVVTPYVGSPSEVESLITDPLEGVLATTSQVSSMSSVSSEGSSMIMLSFVEGTDMNFATLEVREKIDLVKPLLPVGSSTPMIMKLNPNMMPIGHYGLTLKDSPLNETTHFLDTTVVPSLERVPGVATVEVVGGVKRELRLTVDADRLSAYGLSSNHLTQQIKSEYRALPGGLIEEGHSKLSIRVQSSTQTIEDLENLVLLTNEQMPITLKELADFEETYTPTTSFAQVSGEPSLMLSIQKESTANTVEVSAAIRKTLDQLQEKHPGLVVVPLFDQGTIIDQSVRAIGINAIIGALLAVVVLFLFLKDIRTTLIMAISIPISVITTFVFIYFFHLTLNMISLGGVALGIGMLVDNAIVVIENIHRLKQQGLAPKEAAYKGTTEVAQAIIISTLTTISVFLPAIFVQGISAKIFQELAFTVTFSLIASLGVSFTLVPLLASRLLKDYEIEKSHRTLDALRTFYRYVLILSLTHKKRVAALVLLILFLSGFALKGVGITFFPSTDQGIVSIQINLPKGKNQSAVFEVSEAVLERVSHLEGVATTALTTSVSSSSAQVMLVLSPLNARTVSDQDVASAATLATQTIPGAQITASTRGSMMGGSGNQITLNLLGEDLTQLELLGKSIQTTCYTIPGITSIDVKQTKNAPTLTIQVSQNQAIQHGLTNEQIARAIQGALKPIPIMSLEDAKGPIDVTLYSQTALNSGLTEVQNLTLSNLKGVRVPLSALATYKRGEEYHKIERSNQRHTLSLQIDFEGRSLVEVSKDVEASLTNIQIPNGYKIVFGGQVEQMKDSFKILFAALALAVLLVYMIMASQFESFVQPLIIMSVVPVAFSGGILALFIAGVPVSMPALIGFIILSGIVVNNGIVLLDFINRLRQEGFSVEDAILEAGTTRFQPILMTTLTTVLGLLPMTLGIGQGAEIQLPLALTVTGGLLLSTVLTLVVIPVIYKKCS